MLKFIEKVLVVVFLTVILSCNAAQAGAGHVVQPYQFSSSNPSSLAWLNYSYNPQGVRISFNGEVHGWLPAFGFIIATRQGEVGTIFSASFENDDGDQYIPLLDYIINWSWWAQIQGQGPLDLVSDRVIGLVEEPGSYYFEVQAYDEGGDYLQARFTFDIPSFGFEFANVCPAEPDNDYLVVDIELRGIYSPPESAERFSIESADGTVLVDLPNPPVFLSADGRYSRLTFVTSRAQYTESFENQFLATTIVVEGEAVKIPVRYRAPIVPCRG